MGAEHSSPSRSASGAPAMGARPSRTSLRDAAIVMTNVRFAWQRRNPHRSPSSHPSRPHNQPDTSECCTRAARVPVRGQAAPPCAAAVVTAKCGAACHRRSRRRTAPAALPPTQSTRQACVLHACVVRGRLVRTGATVCGGGGDGVGAVLVPPPHRRRNFHSAQPPRVATAAALQREPRQPASQAGTGRRRRGPAINRAHGCKPRESLLQPRRSAARLPCPSGRESRSTSSVARLRPPSARARQAGRRRERRQSSRQSCGAACHRRSGVAALPAAPTAGAVDRRGVWQREPRQPASQVQEPASQAPCRRSRSRCTGRARCRRTAGGAAAAPPAIVVREPRERRSTPRRHPPPRSPRRWLGCPPPGGPARAAVDCTYWSSGSRAIAPVTAAMPPAPAMAARLAGLPIARLPSASQPPFCTKRSSGNRAIARVTASMPPASAMAARLAGLSVARLPSAVQPADCTLRSSRNRAIAPVTASMPPAAAMAARLAGLSSARAPSA